jgi:hypothetical protein
MFTKKELEIIKALGKPKPLGPQKEDHQDVERMMYENDVIIRWSAWIREYTDNLHKIDNALYSSNPSTWIESLAVIGKFTK